MKSTAFIDLLFNMLLGTVFMFIIAFIQIAPEAAKQSIEPKAEFVIIVSWPGDIPNDVDTWLEDPNGEILWFRSQRTESAHLDHDDKGRSEDTSPYNQEITTIRSIVPGEWTLNIHYYKINYEVPTPVEITIDKLNPSFERIIRKTIVLETKWQEETVARFTISEAGTVMGVNELPKKLVKSSEL